MNFDHLTALAENMIIKSCSSTKEIISKQDHSICLKIDNVVSLFCDLGGTTKLVETYDKYFASWILKSYIDCMIQVAKCNSGLISGFEGDGILVIFYGDRKEEHAIKCALEMNWVLSNVLQVSIDELFSETHYKIGHAIGLDTSDAVFSDIGLLDTSYKLWVGTSINNSANLTTIFDERYSLYATENVICNSRFRKHFVPWKNNDNFKSLNIFASSYLLEPK